jgi:hypothetical protein
MLATVDNGQGHGVLRPLERNPLTVHESSIWTTQHAIRPRQIVAAPGFRPGCHPWLGRDALSYLRNNRPNAAIAACPIWLGPSCRRIDRLITGQDSIDR